MKTLVSPQGFEIDGTNEKLLGVALINPEIEDSAIGTDGIEIEHADETKVCWDAQETIYTEQGIREFVDDRGNVCSELDLHFIDEDAGITEPQRLFPEVQKTAEPSPKPVLSHETHTVIHTHAFGSSRYLFVPPAGFDVPYGFYEQVGEQSNDEPDFKALISYLDINFEPEKGETIEIVQLDDTIHQPSLDELMNQQAPAVDGQ